MTQPYPFPTSADEFTDKRVLVTGGTRGIGAAVVHRFQLAGARVAPTARAAPPPLPACRPAACARPPVRRRPKPWTASCSFRPTSEPPPASRPLSVGWQPI